MDNLACPASALAFFHHLWNDGSNFPVHFWESGSYFTNNVHPSCLQEDASISVTCSIAPFGVSCKIRTGCVSSIRIFGVVFLFYFSDGELAKRSSGFKTFLFFPSHPNGKYPQSAQPKEQFEGCLSSCNVGKTTSGRSLLLADK